MRANTAESFWAKVDIGAPDECWPWKLGPAVSGYGRIKWRGSHEIASRMAYQLHHGVTLPRFPRKGKRKDAITVLHTCDNRICCNPAHLWLGTYLDNRLDCVAKGRDNTPTGDNNGSRIHPDRVTRGSGHYNSKLTERDILAIRARADAGESLSQIASEFGVTHGNVWFIAQRKAWKHV